MPNKIKILWVDDEIDLLKAHLFYLKEKGFDVETATNGQDALDMIESGFYDLIFLDENMPGLSGLQTLTRIKEIRPEWPVVMITKSEEENIMEEAIGRKISDYLIKPVNPTQILLSIKKNIDKKRLITETTTSTYRSEFGRISLQINDSFTFGDWTDVYKKLTYWELELENGEGTMDEVLQMQKTEANHAFTKFIKKNYLNWLSGENAPLMSHMLMKEKILPLLDKGNKVVFIVIDNFRYDQWEVLKRDIANDYITEEESIYCSILPTATQYARNALFAGLMPAQIKKMFPEYWLDEIEEGSKNQFEEQLTGTFFKRFRKPYSHAYKKINDHESGKKMLEQLSELLNKNLISIVFNFVDMLSHARTEVKMIKELAANEAAYRSLTRSWFSHSTLKELLLKLKDENVKVVITTDHGTIRVQNPIKVIGDKNISLNLRYKQGKNLNYNPKEVYEIKDPSKAMLPKPNLSTSFIFATNNDFFAYPNNYNHYVSYYKDTFQHGGISLEEMLIPFVILRSK
ncbi:MAG: bifunctional response regulator/alkaline phosphatase family protein [Chlorobi bacterium]|nr:bifunctional response regulator/alkaline phosphatase family protein [Chlorobiota bacterium]